MDRKLKKAINRVNFGGTVLNHRNIGKTADELVALWNADHLDDPVS